MVGWAHARPQPCAQHFKVAPGQSGSCEHEDTHSSTSAVTAKSGDGHFPGLYRLMSAKNAHDARQATGELSSLHEPEMHSSIVVNVSRQGAAHWKNR
jgi:hypothetical protein